MKHRLFENVWTPKDRATLCFIRCDGRLLLIEKKRGLGAGKVNAPGGRIEHGESPVECAIREVQEEIGVTPIDPQARAELRFEFVDGYSLQCFVFLAKSYTGTMISTDEADPFWVPENAIPFDRMWEDDQHWLPLVLEGKTLAAAFVFDGDRMLEKEILVHE
jgi:8-oxo-dGTP diphosphatase